MAAQKSNFISYFLIAFTAALLGFLIGSYSSVEYLGIATQKFLPIQFTNKDKLNKILKIIKHHYVDSINTDSIEAAAINDILDNLDPHSVYLPPLDAKNQNEQLEGNFEGIGIEYFLLNDTLLVSHVRKDGPAAKVGLHQGDKIIAVNDIKLKNTSKATNNIVDMLRGKRGSEVNVTIIRHLTNKVSKVTITRERIIVSSIDASFLLKPQIGYIKIRNFGANTADEFKEALINLKAKGMRQLILDLRGNGGGYLSAATAMADEFLPDKKLIVYTKGLHEARTEYQATADGEFENGKLVVLIDEGSASASEIVTGALQDLDRATIIGRRSFGKGLVQEQFPFTDGSALNLTIARYYTPLGRSIQKAYDRGEEAYREEINNRFKHGDHLSLDSALNDSVFRRQSKTYYTKAGRKVYAGGGIFPDVFVPIDTTMETNFYKQVVDKALMTNFVYRVLIYQEKINDFKSAQEFVLNYQLKERVYQQFLQYCAHHKITVNSRQAEISRPLIAKQLTALLGRYYFNDEGFYQVLNKQDSFIQSALKSLN